MRDRHGAATVGHLEPDAVTGLVDRTGHHRTGEPGGHAEIIYDNVRVPKDNIVVMHFDDIAASPSNPVKGNVINRPKGPNNYAADKYYYRTFCLQHCYSCPTRHHAPFYQSLAISLSTQ